MAGLNKKINSASLLHTCPERSQRMEKVPGRVRPLALAQGRMRRIRAATLMESLIAMVIIVMCLGLGTMIYSNVLSSDKQLLKLKAVCILNRLAEQTKTEKNYLDSEQLWDNWNIKKKVNKYDQTENLYQLTLEAFDISGLLIASRNELIKIE